MTLRSPDSHDLLGLLKQILPSFAEWFGGFSYDICAGIPGVFQVVRVRGFGVFFVFILIVPSR